MAKLCLHSGAAEIGFERLRELRTPAATKTWQPLPHHRLVEMTAEPLRDLGFEIVSQQHATNHAHEEYFGLLELGMTNGHAKEARPDWSLVLGLRNSHNKRFPAALALGQSVFICDNLAFSAEVTLRRKHTSRILQDMPGLVLTALSNLTAARDRIYARTDRYRAIEVDDVRADHLAVAAYRSGVMPAALIPCVTEEWRKPKHEEFASRTLWSLYNCFTECMKQTSPVKLASRTIRLAGMLDGVAELN